MRYVSLFAGIGGFDLALNRLGHECVYVNEWDKYAAQTYEKNFSDSRYEQEQPSTERKGVQMGGRLHTRPEQPQQNSHIDTRDIRTVDSNEIPDFDLLVGGFPCQAFSVAGKRRGFDDTRGTLFFDIARILKDKRPRHFILENVKGLLSHDEGKTFQTILGVLSDLGYEYQWQVLNSKNFGVPQNRERVFIVGHLRGQPRPKVFPIGSLTEQTDEQPVRETQNAPTLQAGYGKGHGGDQFIAGTIDHGKFRQTENRSLTVTANYWKGPDNHGQRTVIKQLNQPKHSNDRVYGDDGISPTLNTMGGGRRQPKVVIGDYRYDEGLRIRKNNISPTIRQEMKGQDVSKSVLLIADMKIRRLTPLECERLQGFPDNWTQGVSDTQRYKQLGNAVTVNVVYEVAKRL